MKRIYHNYELWEDVYEGMYATPGANVAHMQFYAKQLLLDTTSLYNAMSEAVRQYPHSADVWLSNVSANRRAWLGCAACLLKYTIPASVTKEVFRNLEPHQKVEANKIADQIIKIWTNAKDTTKQKRAGSGKGENQFHLLKFYEGVRFILCRER